MMKVMLAWYPVKDLAAAQRFYGSVLGLKRLFEIPGWAEYGHAEGSAAIGLNADPRAADSAGATVVLGVEDLAAWKCKLSDAGVEFVGDDQEIPGVVRIATFRDPFGNTLQLVQSLTA